MMMLPSSTEGFFDDVANYKPEAGGKIAVIRATLEGNNLVDNTPKSNFTMEQRNMMNAPIPGQSLTDTPGNAAWEHPPQFTSLEKALNYVYGRLLNKRQAKKLITMLDNDIPAEVIARTIIFGGFAEGKWTPDLAMMMAKPVVAMVAAIGKASGIRKVKLSMKDRESGTAAMGASLKIARMSPEEMVPPEPQEQGMPSFMEKL